MSPDETLAFVFNVVICGFTWIRWYLPILTVTPLASRRGGRTSAILSPIVTLAVLFLVLRTHASWDVRESGIYLTFYLLMGAAWLGLSANLFPLFGISVRDDALERGNPAAGFAVSGAQLGGMLAFAGANIGDGPGWWVVVFCTMLSGGTLFLLWLLLELFTGISETITVERDEGAGLRLAGLLIAFGLVLGRAVAGNWVSVPATIADFVDGAWPLLALLPVAVVVERISPVNGPGCESSGAFRGALVGFGYFAAAAVYFHLRGPW